MRTGDGTTGGIDVHVKGKGLTVTPALRDLVERKMSRLDKYHGRLQSIDVELIHEKTRASDRQNAVDVVARVPGQTIRVQASAAEIHAAVDEAVDKMYRHLNRKKERQKNHHGSRAAEMLPPGGEEESVEDARIVVERPLVEPLSEEDAIEALDGSGRSLYVFLNARNQQVNVVYRRDGGGYGVIEPRMG
jgi:putative sigma-54 modulation protein